MFGLWLLLRLLWLLIVEGRGRVVQELVWLRVNAFARVISIIMVLLLFLPVTHTVISVNTFPFFLFHFFLAFALLLEMSLEYHVLSLAFLQRLLLLPLFLTLLDNVVLHRIHDLAPFGRTAQLHLQLLLRQLLQLHLLLVELVDCLRVYVCVVVGRVECRGGVLLDPQVLRRLEVVTEYRYYLLDLLVLVLVHEEVERGVQVQQGRVELCRQGIIRD